MKFDMVKGHSVMVVSSKPERKAAIEALGAGGCNRHYLTILVVPLK